MLNRKYKEDKVVFKLGETREEVCRNMRKNKSVEQGRLKNWCKKGKHKLGMLACAAAVMSLGFGSTAHASKSWTVTKDNMKINYSATEHSVTTQVYYPVSSSESVKLVTGGVNYKIYKSGKSGATSAWAGYRDDSSKTVTVYNGIPCYYAAKTMNVSSNKYIAAIHYYGSVSFNDSKSSIAAVGNRTVTW